MANYFDPNGDPRLLNIREDPDAVPGEIALTLRDTTTRNDTIYRISHTDHGTRNQSAILKGDLASDFITYRFFFGFSHFRNSERNNGTHPLGRGWGGQVHGWRAEIAAPCANKTSPSGTSMSSSLPPAWQPAFPLSRTTGAISSGWMAGRWKRSR